MNYLIAMLPVLAIGAIVMLIGIMKNREPGETDRGAIIEGLAWSGSFLVFFSAEFWLIGIS